MGMQFKMPRGKAKKNELIFCKSKIITFMAHILAQHFAAPISNGTALPLTMEIFTCSARAF